MQAIAIGRAIFREGFLAYGENQHRSGFGPGLIELNQSIEDLLIRLVASPAHQKPPWLLIGRGGRPARRFEQLFQLCRWHFLVGIDARAPATTDQMLNTGYVGRML